MAAPPNKPHIRPTRRVQTHPQPPARIVENTPTKSVSQALANSKHQVDATK
jgi:hypothetical protein